jgi:hypothetical protein
MAMREVPRTTLGAYSWDVFTPDECDQLFSLTPVKEQQWVMTGINVIVTPLGLIITHRKMPWIPRDSQKYGMGVI